MYLQGTASSASEVHDQVPAIQANMALVCSSHHTWHKYTCLCKYVSQPRKPLASHSASLVDRPLSGDPVSRSQQERWIATKYPGYPYITPTSSLG